MGYFEGSVIDAFSIMMAPEKAVDVDVEKGNNTSKVAKEEKQSQVKFWGCGAVKSDAVGRSTWLGLLASEMTLCAIAILMDFYVMFKLHEEAAYPDDSTHKLCGQGTNDASRDTFSRTILCFTIEIIWGTWVGFTFGNLYTYRAVNLQNHVLFSMAFGIVFWYILFLTLSSEPFIPDEKVPVVLGLAILACVKLVAFSIIWFKNKCCALTVLTPNDKETNNNN